MTSPISESRSQPSPEEAAKRLRYLFDGHSDTRANPYILEAAQLLEAFARSETASIPEEFAQLASFYEVTDMAALVRMQQEHIEGLQAKLPPTTTFPGPQRVREG